MIIDVILYLMILSIIKGFTMALCGGFLFSWHLSAGRSYKLSTFVAGWLG